MALTPLGVPWLLRTWRESVAGLSLGTAATALGIAKSTISQWETSRRRAKRGIGLQHLITLDQLYEAGGALVDLAQAIGTPDALPPAVTWAYNPQGPSRPCWAWLRPGPGRRRTTALVTWAAFAIEVDEVTDDSGVFVTSSISMSNPAVWIHLREPGWVDFGRGEPPAALGLPRIDALERANVARGGHSPAGLVAPDIVDRFVDDPEFARAVFGFFGTRQDLVETVFSTKSGWTKTADLTRRPVTRPAESLVFDGDSFRRLREARGMSQADAAAAASALPPEGSISDDQVRLMESGGEPRVEYLRARLDTIYRGDGRTFVTQIPRAPHQPATTFEFPKFWIGPVWFAFASTNGHDVGDITIRWDGEQKSARISDGTVVTCRRPIRDSPPFRVRCPDGWVVTGGMGARPDAHDVNWGWRSSREPAVPADRTVRVHEEFLRWFGRSVADWLAFEQSQGP